MSRALRATVVLAVSLAAVVATPAQWRDGSGGSSNNNVAVSPLDIIVFPAEAESPFSPKHVGGGRDVRARFLKASEAIFGVAVRLKLFLHVSDKENFLVSPVSVAAAIGELILGARGRSREKLEWLLSAKEGNRTSHNSSSGGGEVSDGEDAFELHRQLGGLLRLMETGQDRPDDGYVLNMASAFFVQPDLKIKPSYAHAVKEFYDLKFWPLDFSGDPKVAQKVVNKWTSDHTRGKIVEALPGGLPPTTATLLLNAVYFKGDWETPFDPELTVPGLFRTTPNRSVNVEFMRGNFDTLYAESEEMGCRLVALPYKGAQAAMFVIMPLKGKAEHDLQRLIASLTFYNVRELVASAQNRSVTVVLPKMVLKDTLSIRDAVTKVKNRLKEENRGDPGPSKADGRRRVRSDAPQRYEWRYNFRHQYYFSIPSRFGNSFQSTETGEDGGHHQQETTQKPPADDGERLDLDMSGASEDLRFKIDDVLHQVVVEVSENGTEGAGLTTGTVDYLGGGKTFKVDSPFMFFVRHEVTLASLFWGIVADPTSGNGEYV